MAEIEVKKYLDLVGLTKYDEKIKAYIKSHGSDVTEKIIALIGAAEKDENEATILSRLADLEAAVGDVSELGEDVINLTKAIIAEVKARKAQIGDLGKQLDEQGEPTEEDHTVKSYVDYWMDQLTGSQSNLADRVSEIETLHATMTIGEGDDADERFMTVAEEAEAAVAKVIGGAPEAFDTLKEIADWITEDEAGAAALVNRVAKNEEAIEELREEIEANNDKWVAITNLEINALFAGDQKSDQSVADAISELPAGEALKLNADQNIVEDIRIDKPCYIDANGSTFEGTIRIAAGVDAIIVNATFANPVEIYEGGDAQ